MLASSAGRNELNCLSFKLSLLIWQFNISTGVSTKLCHSCLRSSVDNFALTSFMLLALAIKEKVICNVNKAKAVYSYIFDLPGLQLKIIMYEVQNKGNENSLTNSFLKVIASFLSHNANALEANVNNAHNPLHWIGPGIVWDCLQSNQLI